MKSEPKTQALAQQSLTLLDLPDELLIHILSQMSTKELITNVLPTNKRLKELGGDETLWKHFLKRDFPDFYSIHEKEKAATEGSQITWRKRYQEESIMRAIARSVIKDHDGNNFKTVTQAQWKKFFTRCFPPYNPWNVFLPEKETTIDWKTLFFQTLNEKCIDAKWSKQKKQFYRALVCMNCLQTKDINDQIQSFLSSTSLDLKSFINQPEHAVTYQIFSDSFSLKLSLFNIAIACGHSSLVKSLLQQGADVTSNACTDIDSDTSQPIHLTSLHIAVLTGNEDVVSLLLQHGLILDSDVYTSDPNVLLIAAANNHVNVIQRLLSAYETQQIKPANISATLNIACFSGNKEVVALLLKYRITAGITPANCSYALSVAAMVENNKSIIELLLQHDADPNADPDVENLPLYLLAELGDEASLKCILEYFKTTGKAFRGSSKAMSIATKKGHGRVIALFKEYGINSVATTTASPTFFQPPPQQPVAVASTSASTSTPDNSSTAELNKSW